MLPKGKVLKSLKVSAPNGATVALGQLGQGLGIECTPELTTYKTGWLANKSHSDIVQIHISTNGAPGKDVTSVQIDDIVYGD